MNTILFVAIWTANILIILSYVLVSTKTVIAHYATNNVS